MPTKQVYLVELPPFDKSVAIANGTDVPATSVVISEHFDPGMERVFIVHTHPDEYIRVVNPGLLPLLDKIAFMGPPPCPLCGQSLKDTHGNGRWSCGDCHCTWTGFALEILFKGKKWSTK